MKIDVNENERGVIRLFAVDLSVDELASFTEPDFANDGPSPLQTALGVSYIDSDFVELFPVSNLDGLGLAGYLVEGLGVAEADVSGDRPMLNAVEGHVLIVLSKAFGGFATQGTPQEPLRWIGTYVEEGAPVRFDALPAESAKGVVVDAPVKPAKSDARMSGMVATYALLAMFLLVGLMIWVGG